MKRQRSNRADQERVDAWFVAAMGTPSRSHITCAHPLCPGKRKIVQLHHVVYRQHVRREHGDEWDPRNALPLCDDCHASHHQRGRYQVPVWVLRDENLAFAAELMGAAAYDYLRRYYTGDDPRLDALLSEAA